MNDKFQNGLVFGFDVGTSSIGWAVRKGNKFLDVGVLICPEDTNDLSKRREMRRQRRTLRSKKNRRKWLVDQLTQIGFPRAINKTNDPITLRLRALDGEKLAPDELHGALCHLFKRRGYSKVPWATDTAPKKGGKENESEEGEIVKEVGEMKAKLNGRHPAQYLADEKAKAGKSPTQKWARKIYWPREALETEFLAIVAAQAINHPALKEKADWLLYGETQAKNRNGADYHVFFKTTEVPNPGVMGMRWPRFDNRSPSLDSQEPVDELGRPLHVVRRNKPAFANAQWELALMNFRVLDAGTRQKIDPRTLSPEYIESLRAEWTKKGSVTITRLKKLTAPFSDKFLLMEDQKPLSPESSSGRARYASPTLEKIKAHIADGNRFDPAPPSLQRKGETKEASLNRYLAEIKHPLVRHRLVLFRGLLDRLVKDFGSPDLLVVEAVRSLALGKTKKTELNKRNEQFRKERESAREDLSAAGKSVSSKAITRYRLWKEAQSTCPFCGDKITQAQLLNGEADTEHLVPRAIVDCSELYNLTVGHIRCNREIKGDKTPYAAFSHHPEQWAVLKANAQKCFSNRKLEIFLSPNAEEIVEQRSDLQHTAYIARVIRHISLIRLGWLNKEGRDPTPELQNPALSFQVTNGQLTSRLRDAWGLNKILHPLPPCQRWEDLTGEQKQQFSEKNRGDLRHHALDAMVIACTLPWLAHRTHGAKDANGDHGWWTQNPRRRSLAANPVFPGDGLMHRVCKEWIEKVDVRHHVSRSNHQKGYYTTLYARKAPDTYVAREVFTSLSPKNLKDIWPKELASYCEAAWQLYSEESPDIEGELKRNNKCVPYHFTEMLCFSHFQRWREDGAPEFQWPKQVKIPIRSVSSIGVKGDNAATPYSPGTHAFVKRNGFREVRIHLAEDEKSFVPVFVPYWKGDQPIHAKPIKTGEKPVLVLRCGMVVKTKKPFSSGRPAGKYRILVTGQTQLRLLPAHIANDKNILLAYGLGTTGLQPYWPDFIRALGYEPPHPPSAESPSVGPDKA